MKNIPLIIGLYLLSTYSAFVDATEVKTLPGLVFQSTLSDASIGQNLHSFNVTEDSVDLIWSKEQGAKGKVINWTEVDLNGKMIFEKNLLNLLKKIEPEGIDGKDPQFANYTYSNQRMLYLPTTTQEGKSKIYKLSKAESKNNQVAVVDLSMRSLDVTDVVTENSNSILFLGNSGLQPHLIDSNGTETIKFTSKNIVNKQLRIINAFEESGESLLLFGEIVEAGVSKVWVARVTKTGELVEQIYFDGKPLRMVKNNDDGFAILVYEVINEENVVSLVEISGVSFKTNWVKKVFTEKLFSPRLDIRPSKTGGYVLAGAKDRGIWISKINNLGDTVWTYAKSPTETANLEIVKNVRFNLKDNKYFVAYSAFIVEGRTQKEVIKLLRFDES